MRVICSYDDWYIGEYEGKYYFFGEDEERVEVELIDCVPIKNQTDEELYDASGNYDYSGELDNLPIYCYWKEVK